MSTIPAAAPARPARDLRLDIARGWMQVSIFVSHVAGTVFAWGIHSAWGLSDSSEQFVLLSGLTLGSVFSLKAARDGFKAAGADMARRTLRLYGTHLTVFFMFAALVLAAEMAVPLPGEVARLGWSFLAERPWFAVPAALAMVYQPAFMGILPVFIWSMMALPPFLRLAARFGPGWALAPAVAAYAAVPAGALATPSMGGTGIAFEPLAWSLLFLGGAIVGRRALLTGEGVPRRRWLALAAGTVVLAGFAARLVEHGFIPGPVAAVAAAMHKEALAPARLAHALALAYLVAVLVPREAGWMRAWPAQVLATIGRNSLRVFCAGLFLSWGASAVLARWPEDAAWLDPLLIAGGTCALATLALASEGWRRVPQRVGRGGVTE